MIVNAIARDVDWGGADRDSKERDGLGMAQVMESEGKCRSGSAGGFAICATGIRASSLISIH